ncbi:MAG: class D beta-lactamase [Proteobacteria bacterium]|nr:class D beta-lactamase [Pseudomonadota bacterium]
MVRFAAGLLGLFGIGLASLGGAAPLCTLIVDAGTGAVVYERGHCAERVTPASTFKVPLALIGYDSGYLTDEHHPALPYREGYVATDPSWKTTVDPTSWITNSVVWYSQQLTTWLGPERLQRYVDRFGYGNRDLRGNPGMNDGLTQAWLDSSLRISPKEQVAFLAKVVNRQLGLAPKAYDMTARITAVGKLPGGWDVHGKSGTGFGLKLDGSGPDLTRQVGWFVGWAVRDTRTVVFAAAGIDEQPEPTRAGVRLKQAFLAELPRLLDKAAPGTP